MTEEIELKDFTIEVERFLANNKNVTPIDAIIHLSEKYGMEVETVGKLVRGTLKEKVLLEAKKTNQMKDNTIPNSLL